MLLNECLRKWPTDKVAYQGATARFFLARPY